MQARAIIEAALEVAAEGVDVLPEIMVPLVGHLDEFENQRAIVDATAREVFDEKDREVDYLVGTMIELPRACLTAGDIAARAEFFSGGRHRGPSGVLLVRHQRPHADHSRTVTR
jgi:pyruvate,orthophosphate dikinase